MFLSRVLKRRDPSGAEGGLHGSQLFGTVDSRRQISGYDCLNAGEGHLYSTGREVGPERYPAAHLRLHAPAPSSPHLLLLSGLCSGETG